MQKTHSRPEKKSLNTPDETRPFEKGKVEVLKIADVTVGRATFQPGWKWSSHVKPIAKTKSCEAPHFGYVVSGTLVTLMDDGTKIVSKAGDVLNIPPGHDGWVEGSETAVFVDFQGMVDYAKKK
jgi:quercetin dioxygenase-like cupin family protein